MNDAGRIGFLIKGDYVATDTYEFLDVVYYNGSSYVAKKTTIGNAPAEDNEYWHIFAKGSLSPVIGVKGDAEEEYREGYVNITSDDVGALGKDGDSAENTITFESGDTADPAVLADMEVMESGEKHGGLFRKLSLAVRNIRWLKKFTEKLNTDLSATNTALQSKAPSDHTHDGRYYTKQQADDKTMLKTYDKQHSIDFSIKGYSTFVVPEIRIDTMTNIPFIPNLGQYRILLMEPIISGTQWQLRVTFWVNGEIVYKVCDLN